MRLCRSSREVQNLHLELIRQSFAQKVGLAPSFAATFADVALDRRVR